MARVERCFNIEDLRRQARRRLPKGIFELVDLGSEDGRALVENQAAFARIRLKPHLMVDLSERDWSIELLGKRCELPLGISPTGVASLCWRQGEVALAKAAASAGIPYTYAQGAGAPMETVAKIGGRLWFQVEMWEEVHLSDALIDRARLLEFEALVVTIDGALGRVREHNARNGYSYPFRLNVRALADLAIHPRYVARVVLASTLRRERLKNANYPPEYRRMVSRRADSLPRSRQSMTWNDIARLREAWPRKLIVKGVLTAEDARLAIQHGADGLIVSNHGGRAMDSSISTVEGLMEVVPAVQGKAAIMVDGGIRRGSDIVKALLLGADMAMIGRAGLYGVAAGGQEGAERALGLLRDEFEKTMGYLGCRRVGELDTHSIAM